MAVPAVDLTTVAAVQGYMQGATAFTPDQTLEIEREITALSRAASTVCSRKFIRASYTEVRNGSGTATLVLRQLPVVSVSSIQMNRSDLRQASAPGSGDGWEFSENAVYLNDGGIFETGTRNIVVTYTAGYLPITDPLTDIPQDLQDSIVMAVADRFKRRTNIGILSKSIAGETITYGAITVPKMTGLIWNNYKKVAYAY